MLANGPGRVDLLLEAEQSNLPLPTHCYRRKQFREWAAKTIEADDGKRVAGTGIGEKTREAWSMLSPGLTSVNTLIVPACLKRMDWPATS